MLTAYDQDPSLVPVWHASDFDMIYIFHLKPPAVGGPGKRQLTFEVDQEGLNDSLSSSCPT